MLRKLWCALRRLLIRLICPNKTPVLETFSDPGVVIQAKPRQITESVSKQEGTVETFSDPMITIHAKPRREI